VEKLGFNKHLLSYLEVWSQKSVHISQLFHRHDMKQYHVLDAHLLSFKTEGLVKRRNFILFSTKELSKVLNIGVSTSYTSGAWSVHTYI